MESCPTFTSKENALECASFACAAEAKLQHSKLIIFQDMMLNLLVEICQLLSKKHVQKTTLL
jgi:hypothetical protein